MDTSKAWLGGYEVLQIIDGTVYDGRTYIKVRVGTFPAIDSQTGKCGFEVSPEVKYSCINRQTLQELKVMSKGGVSTMRVFVEGREQ